MDYPQVENPKTGDVFMLYSDGINALLEKGVKEVDIQTWPRVTPVRLNRQSVFVDDVLYQIMLNSDINDVITICQTDKNASKMCQSSSFWKNKIQHEGYLLLDKKTHFTIDDYFEMRDINNQISRLWLIGKLYSPKSKNPFHNNKFLTKKDLQLILPVSVYNQINGKEPYQLWVDTKSNILHMGDSNYQSSQFKLDPETLKMIITKLLYYNIIEI